ncbi:hypothetical protein NP233_g6633 [Leucocoprinus birnbaumii]|uniref:Uncharacterized protein n=1 Tax=Leucocoprinus birnbaumii TaxID=56174 RepID=A0AAD5YPU3_9AGAR|nr:hypothetical protein NP233_g6633 [Leucocoprinus birnbaumii]
MLPTSHGDPSSQSASSEGVIMSSYSNTGPGKGKTAIPNYGSPATLRPKFSASNLVYSATLSPDGVYTTPPAAGTEACTPSSSSEEIQEDQEYDDSETMEEEEISPPDTAPDNTYNTDFAPGAPEVCKDPNHLRTSGTTSPGGEPPVISALLSFVSTLAESDKVGSYSAAVDCSGRCADGAPDELEGLMQLVVVQSSPPATKETSDGVLNGVC